MYRALGKKILFIYHGSDSRPPYLNKGDIANNANDYRKIKNQIKIKKKNVLRTDRWAHWVIDNPASSHFHERKIINWFKIGNPCIKIETSANQHLDKKKIVALHAPSNPIVKGSDVILKNAELVKREIQEFELHIIKDKSNEEVLEALDGCDFVIDQLYSDTPAASFAMEAAAVGKPSIVGGSGWSDEWLEASGLGEYPSYVCKPENIGIAIREMVQNKNLRRKIGTAGLKRAEDWNYLNVSKRILQVLTDDFSEDWMSDPQEIIAFYSGVGMPAPEVAKIVSTLAKKYGFGTLYLNDKPELLKKAKDFCQQYGYEL